MTGMYVLELKLAVEEFYKLGFIVVELDPINTKIVDPITNKILLYLGNKDPWFYYEHHIDNYPNLSELKVHRTLNEMFNEC